MKEPDWRNDPWWYAQKVEVVPSYKKKTLLDQLPTLVLLVFSLLATAAVYKEIKRGCSCIVFSLAFLVLMGMLYFIGR